jgi:hypothetical protein
MMMRATIAVFAFTATSPALAQQNSVANFDIAGVTLGATPAEARAALVKAGYRVTSTVETESFEQAVAREAAFRLGKPPSRSRPAGISNIIASAPHQEAIAITFFQRPAGSRVVAVHLKIPTETMTSGALKAQVVAKYGKPTVMREGGMALYWCSPQVARVCSLPVLVNAPRDDSQPRLFVRVSEGTLRLTAGTEAEAAAAGERNAAIERLAPKTEKAAF